MNLMPHVHFLPVGDQSAETRPPFPPFSPPPFCVRLLIPGTICFWKREGGEGGRKRLKRRGRRRGRGGEAREEGGGGELTDGSVELNWRDRTSRLMPTSISSSELLLIVLELVSTGAAAAAASCKTVKKWKCFKHKSKETNKLRLSK